MLNRIYINGFFSFGTLGVASKLSFFRQNYFRQQTAIVLVCLCPQAKVDIITSPIFWLERHVITYIVPSTVLYIWHGLEAICLCHGSFLRVRPSSCTSVSLAIAPGVTSASDKNVNAPSAAKVYSREVGGGRFVRLKFPEAHNHID